MDLLPDENIIWQGRPSWRSHIAWFLVWIPAALLPAVIGGAVKKSGRDPWGGYGKWLLISLVLVLLVVAYDALRRRATEYTVTDKRLQIRRGIASRRESSTHLDRIQNLNTNQSLIERLLSVGSVDFDTAGSDPSEADFRFRGVADPHGLVARLQPHIQRTRTTPRIN